MPFIETGKGALFIYGKANTVKTIIKPLAVVIRGFIFTVQAEARGDAMGGTGVASTGYGSAPMINPVLLTKAKLDDGIRVVLPSAGIQVMDKDNHLE